MSNSITIRGTQYRVAYNMRALLAYTAARGSDIIPDQLDLEGVLLMMLVCISEGERLEGRDFNPDVLLELTPEEFAGVSAEFDKVFLAQAQPATAKKKEPATEGAQNPSM